MAILTINLVDARVYFVAECDGLIWFVTLFAAHFGGIIHRFVAKDQDQGEYKKSNCTFVVRISLVVFSIG